MTKCCTLEFQINVRVKINVWARKFAKKKTINVLVQIDILTGKFSKNIENLVRKHVVYFMKKHIILADYSKTNKRMVPNKIIRVGKILKINEHTPYVYLEP